MLAIVATMATAAVVVYSISKSLEYPELFAVNDRNRMGLFIVNVLAVIVGSAVVAWSTVGGDDNQRGAVL